MRRTEDEAVAAEMRKGYLLERKPGRFNGKVTQQQSTPEKNAKGIAVVRELICFLA